MAPGAPPARAADRDLTVNLSSVVGGRAVAGAPGGTLASVNPARLDDVVAEVALGDEETFVAACRAAREAQRAWAEVPAPVRGRAIAAIGRVVESNKEALARLVTREVGKPSAEALGEVQEVIDTCDFFLGEGRRLYGQTVPSEMPDKQLFTFRVPVGVVAVVTAGNFPVAVPSWYLVPALLAGRHLQSPCLELGGKNPMVVTPSADLDLAVEGALFSGFGTAGQRCTSLGTLIVHESVHDDLTARLGAAVAGAPVGDPARDVLYGPMLDRRFAERFEGYLGWIAGHHKTLGSSGLGRITAANPRHGFVGDPEAGLYYHPVVVDGVRPDDQLFREETFGPIVGVTTYRSLPEAVELANAPGYGLSSSIYTTDPMEAFAFRRGVSAGMVSVNNSTSGAEAHLPFGGNGKSGNGSRQSGVWMLDQVTRWQAMNWDYSGRLQKAQMDVLRLEPDLTYRLDA